MSESTPPVVSDTPESNNPKRWQQRYYILLSAIWVLHFGIILPATERPAWKNDLRIAREVAQQEIADAENLIRKLEIIDRTLADSSDARKERLRAGEVEQDSTSGSLVNEPAITSSLQRSIHPENKEAETQSIEAQIDILNHIRIVKERKAHLAEKIAHLSKELQTLNIELPFIGITLDVKQILYMYPILFSIVFIYFQLLRNDHMTKHPKPNSQLITSDLYPIHYNYIKDAEYIERPYLHWIRINAIGSIIFSISFYVVLDATLDSYNKIDFPWKLKVVHFCFFSALIGVYLANIVSSILKDVKPK
jgi:hypothetical protein